MNSQYTDDNQYYAEALAFIGSENLMALTPGKLEIDPGNVWVNIIEPDMRPSTEARLETHDEFIDIHVPLSADESFGVKPRSECTSPIGENDTVNDILFYDDPIDKTVLVKAGEMIVFAPDTAHSPLIGSGKIRKAIFKVRVA